LEVKTRKSSPLKNLTFLFPATSLSHGLVCRQKRCTCFLTGPCI